MPVEAGTNWKLARDKLSVKKYPLCFCTHRALDGMLDLIAANPVAAEKVSRVTVSISRTHATILRNHLPQTGLEAKFSMEFAMASALIARRASLAELQDEFVLRPEIQALMPRVAIEIEEREDPAQPGKAIYDLVRVETTDGRRLESARITQVRGGPEQPLTSDELWTKFEGCLQVGQARVPARKLFDALMSLDQLARVSQVPGLGAV